MKHGRLCRRDPQVETALGLGFALAGLVVAVAVFGLSATSVGLGLAAVLLVVDS